MIRYNTSTGAMESFVNGAWASFAVGAWCWDRAKHYGEHGLTRWCRSLRTVRLALTSVRALTQIVQENASAQIIQNVGSVGTPSYSFSGNTSTGIFAPAANKLSLVYQRHFGRFTISMPNGNFGVGTATTTAAMLYSIFLVSVHRAPHFDSARYSGESPDRCQRHGPLQHDYGGV